MLSKVNLIKDDFVQEYGKLQTLLLTKIFMKYLGGRFNQLKHELVNYLVKFLINF